MDDVLQAEIDRLEKHIEEARLQAHQAHQAVALEHGAAAHAALAPAAVTHRQMAEFIVNAILNVGAFNHILLDVARFSDKFDARNRLVPELERYFTAFHIANDVDQGPPAFHKGDVPF